MDRKQQELVAKVFDGNMLPDGTVEVGIMTIIWLVMRMMVRMRVKVVFFSNTIIMMMIKHNTSKWHSGGENYVKNDDVC